ARAGAGARLALDPVHAALVQLAGLVLADRFEDGDDVDGPAVGPGAGQNAAAVDEHAGNVEPRHRHDATGHVLVAAAERQQAVVVHATGDDLDAVGDDLARHQAVAHALMAHHDPVAGGRRSEDLA